MSTAVTWVFFARTIIGEQVSLTIGPQAQAAWASCALGAQCIGVLGAGSYARDRVPSKQGASDLATVAKFVARRLGFLAPNVGSVF